MSGVARRRPTHAITATNHGTTTDPNSHRPGHVQLDRPNGARSETGGVAAPDISCQVPTSPATARNPDAQVMVRRCGLMSTPGAFRIPIRSTTAQSHEMDVFGPSGDLSIHVSPSDHVRSG